ncbi:MAG: hypothetical protein KBF26_09795 [Opitutaceae bacterium]|nr:hypothetical protein [Opitutaceae bacterium]
MLCAVVNAQETAAVATSPAAETKTDQPGIMLMQESLTLRSAMADAIASGAETAEVALTRLRQTKSPSGLPLSADAGFAYAAIDVGHRLLLRHPAEAELFFRAAETALDEEVKRTDDAKAKDKAQHLQKLAMIRGNYLNKTEQAQADMAAAVKLQPEDKYLGQFQRYLATRTVKPEQALVPKEGSK